MARAVPRRGLGYEQREGVELAFIAALQHLPASQRAVLILREVLGFSAAETAESLDTTVASVNSALQRARKAVDERAPERSQQATLRALGDDERARRSSSATSTPWGAADVDAMVAMLAEDAAWSMPPLATWFGGVEQVRGFLEHGPLSGEWRWRHLPASANGQPTVAVYHWDEASADAPAVRARRADAARATGSARSPPSSRARPSSTTSPAGPRRRSAGGWRSRRSGCPRRSDERQRANSKKRAQVFRATCRYR